LAGGNVPVQITQPVVAIQIRQTTMTNTIPQVTIREPATGEHKHTTITIQSWARKLLRWSKSLLALCLIL